MVKTECFLDINEKIDKIIPIVEQYKFVDVAKAVFCIGECINNRSAIESILALNGALLQYSSDGTKRIETYGDFKNFYNLIKNMIKPEGYEDVCVEDYGEVFIDVYGKKYPIILGTGYNMVFACMQLLPYLAEYIGKKEELVEVLSYNSFIIEYLKDENTRDGNEGVRLTLPNEKLYNKINRFFSEIDIREMKKIVLLLECYLCHFFKDKYILVI